MAIAVVPYATIAQVLHLAAGSATATLRGTFDSVPEDFWSTLLLQSARGVVFAGLLAALGWGLAILLRSAAGALAVAFSYVVALEVLLAPPNTWWGQWKLSHHVLGWQWAPGIDVILRRDPSGGGAQESVVHIDQLRAGLYLAGATAMVLGAAHLLRTRRGAATSYPQPDSHQVAPAASAPSTSGRRLRASSPR